MRIRVGTCLLLFFTIPGPAQLPLEQVTFSLELPRAAVGAKLLNELKGTTMVDRTCSEYGGDMDQIEKTTFTGREMREYKCRKCGRTEIVDCGIALWKALSDAGNPDDKLKWIGGISL